MECSHMQSEGGVLPRSGLIRQNQCAPRFALRASAEHHRAQLVDSMGLAQ